MQIASKLARYSLGEGDVLRRAMGKKDLEQMAQQRTKFRQGATENGIGEDVSMRVFDKMEKFASYGFNKSHAAAYGYLSYVTAYFKANYPKEWMAALMTCDSDDLTKVAKFIRECQSMGIAILPPDVNEAGQTFAATPKGIRFAMSGIKGVGSGVVDAIIEERRRSGPYTGLYQFLKRIDTKRVGKKVVEDLVEAGCFDFTGWSRDALCQSVDPMFETAAREQKEASQGVMSLFSLIGDTAEARFSKAPETKLRRTKMDILLKEKVLMGFFLTGHPMDGHKEILKRLSCVSLSKIGTMTGETVFRSAFIVEGVQVRFSSKSQKKFAILNISDGIEQFELPIWPELYEEKSHLLLENKLLYAVLHVEKKDEEMRLNCKWLDDLSQANDAMVDACDQAFDKAKQQANRFAYAKPKAEAKPKEAMKAPSGPCMLKVDADSVRLSHILLLKTLFEKHRGSTPVQVDFVVGDKAIATVHIDSAWGVALSPEFDREIAQHPIFHRGV